jgi:hypothetical protein
LTNDLAVQCYGASPSQLNFNVDRTSLTGLYGGDGNAIGTTFRWYWQEPYYPYHPGYTHTITTIVVNGHRVCGCPNCDGDCCSCADCKVKRLEKRVAELEAKDGA